MANSEQTKRSELLVILFISTNFNNNTGRGVPTTPNPRSPVFWEGMQLENTSKLLTRGQFQAIPK